LSQFLASKPFWQAKIWGLLHDPVFKALHNNTGRGGNSFWQELAVMQDWQEQGWNPETSSAKALERIHLADFIASASDRAAIGSLSTSVNYAPGSDRTQGLEISHLLSGKKQPFKVRNHDQFVAQKSRADYLNDLERQLLDPVRQMTCPQKVFWWLWRCLPEAACRAFGDDDSSLLLMPAETRLPDASIWAHTSLTAAFAGALAGYDLTTDDLKRWQSGKEPSSAYLATFSFTPIQELIKASRKMRDFWAGSWILHYLSAKVSWALAWKYGPDCLIYPSLFQQPLIDHWLLSGIGDQPGEFQGWEDEFGEWIKTPSERQLLTAGFPNVLVVLLPKDRVQAAMQLAEQTLKQEWAKLGKLVFRELQENRRWMKDLPLESHIWKGWLDSQWQTYWSALPVGAEGEELKSAAIPVERDDTFQAWIEVQNRTYQVSDRPESKARLFQDEELTFLREAYNHRLETQGRRFSVNVGSWWAAIFDQTRLSLTAVKNFRTWEIPTALSVRSTVSGVGAAVHMGNDWVPEGEVKRQWQRQAGLFDGSEQLNATETLKRGLHLVLPKLLQLEEDKVNAAYPDLTAGVAGYLKVKGEKDKQHVDCFHEACRSIRQQFLEKEAKVLDTSKTWGIPWMDDGAGQANRYYHPRFLNAGWLVEELDVSEEQAKAYRQEIQQAYPGRNPADWYVLAAGDGDSMNEWLKGKKLLPYRDYIPDALSAPKEVKESFERFRELQKRMGPSSHNALSRALLDFSNQLVPYLTEQRYAGRLIYGGGDDVLAYTNLWEWDSWLWDIRQCFRGDTDSCDEFKNQGDYWQWNSSEKLPEGVLGRPLFTMGDRATISFGIVIAHHSVPLAIALEQLWDAEKEGAKEHVAPDGQRKDAVQVRVLYGNGNVMRSTSKFAVFEQWRQLLEADLEPALFEQAAQVWEQHPIPDSSAIAPWTQAFCDRREALQDGDLRQVFQLRLEQFLHCFWQTTLPEQRDAEVKNWLKLAAFVLRNRDIQLRK
jgi:CRISPR-associated protein Cmr2